MSRELANAQKLGDDPAVARDVIVRLLVTEAERKAMQAEADKVGLKLSDWIRRRCFKTAIDVPAATEPTKRKGR